MIVFSHGFGVDKNSRGLFSDISSLFNEKDVLLFDYNKVDTKNKTITIASLDDQAQKLQEILDGIDEPINLVCHSQGCLVAALANPVGLQSILFLAPASTTNSSDFKALFGTRLEPGSGDTPDKLLRKDGTTTIISQDYWGSLDAIGDVEELYSELASNTFLTIIGAGDDGIVKTSFPQLENKAEIHVMTGADHNFTGSSRGKLLDVFRRLSSTIE
jgi:pimeloyl-ACP methyl ester carboxylesterase